MDLAYNNNIISGTYDFNIDRNTRIRYFRTIDLMKKVITSINIKIFYYLKIGLFGQKTININIPKETSKLVMLWRLISDNYSVETMRIYSHNRYIQIIVNGYYSTMTYTSNSLYTKETNDVLSYYYYKCKELHKSDIKKLRDVIRHTNIINNIELQELINIIDTNKVYLVNCKDTIISSENINKYLDKIGIEYSYKYTIIKT